MTERNYVIKSVVFDAETNDMLKRMANADDRTDSALVRTLVREEFARRYSQPNPAVTVAEAQTAAEVAK